MCSEVGIFDDRDFVEQELEQVATIGRCEYKSTCQVSKMFSVVFEVLFYRIKCLKWFKVYDSYPNVFKK